MVPAPVGQSAARAGPGPATPAVRAAATSSGRFIVVSPGVGCARSWPVCRIEGNGNRSRRQSFSIETHRGHVRRAIAIGSLQSMRIRRDCAHRVNADSFAESSSNALECDYALKSLCAQHWAMISLTESRTGSKSGPRAATMRAALLVAALAFVACVAGLAAERTARGYEFEVTARTIGQGNSVRWYRFAQPDPFLDRRLFSEMLGLDVWN